MGLCMLLVWVVIDGENEGFLWGLGGKEFVCRGSGNWGWWVIG